MPLKDELVYKERPAFSTLAIAIWFLLELLGWIFLVAAMTQPWVEGSYLENGMEVTHKVGLFKHCVDHPNSNECFSNQAWDITIEVWEAAAAFWIIGLIFLTLTVIFILLTFCVKKLLPGAKILQSMSNLFLIIAIILMPFGYPWLDDACPDSNSALSQIANEDGQCGLVCDDSEMGFFKLCYPYEHGTAVWLMLTGSILVFIGTCVGATVALVYQRSYRVN